MALVAKRGLPSELLALTFGIADSRLIHSGSLTRADLAKGAPLEMDNVLKQ